MAITIGVTISPGPVFTKVPVVTLFEELDVSSTTWPRDVGAEVAVDGEVVAPDEDVPFFDGVLPDCCVD